VPDVASEEEEEKTLEMEELTEDATAEAVDCVGAGLAGTNEGRVALVGGASKSS
jgi:hypothetical protein